MENNEENLSADPAGNINSTSVADWYDRSPQIDNDLYPQRGNSYRMLDEDQKQALIKNIIHDMNGIKEGPEKEMSVNLQLCHWFRIDIGLGIAVAKELDLDLGEMMKQMPQAF